MLKATGMQQDAGKTAMTLQAYFKQLTESVDDVTDVVFSGKIVRISGVLIEARGLKLSIGSICSIPMGQQGEKLFAEVIGFAQHSAFLIAFQDPVGILPGTSVHFVDKIFKISVGYRLLGRIVNGFCEPLDNQGSLQVQESYPIVTAAINPVERRRIDQPLDVGVRAINALLTIGVGQRIGIFAGSGVGKSVLLGMIARNTTADVVVVGLIGERGREVKEFIEENIGAQHLHKSIVVAAPIDSSPLERGNGALTAMTIAEYFRDKGHTVLLIIDSLTRYAQALRQMYVQMGEPVSSKGYSPSVFARLSQLVERCGYGARGKGSVTAIFTVLTEGDDLNDPVADHVRSVLDGHIVLSRQLAQAGHFPAIDIQSSISRVMKSIVSPAHYDCFMAFRRIFAHYKQHEDLIKMGMYKAGSDQLLDKAIACYHNLLAFLQQSTNEKASLQDCIEQLTLLFQDDRP